MELILWEYLHVLFDLLLVESSVDVEDQQEWVIHSWKLFPFSGVHVLETFSGKILYMFADTPYPLSASLMKKMLKHKLEVEIDGVGNDMTYAVQLIQLIKNQLASCAFGWFLRYVVPTGRVIATVSIKVPTGSRKRTGRDPRGNIMILPPVTMEEQIAVQRETKARTILLQSLPEDHMADFHHLDDAKDIWLAVKARFGGNEESKKMRKSMLKQEFADFKISESEGLHKGYDRFQKVLSQLNQMQARPDNEDCNMKFLRALPPSWSQVAITLKTKGGLDFLSFDDLYNKLRTLEIDVKGGSSYDSRVPAASTRAQLLKPYVLEIWIWKNLTSRWQMAMLSVRNHLGFEKKLGMLRKKVDSKSRFLNFKINELVIKSEVTKALVSVDSMLNWSDHESEDMEKGASEVYGMIAGYGDDAVIPAVDAADGVSTDGIFADGVSVAAGVGADGVSVTSSDATDAETQFALMGLSPQVKLEESNARFDKWKESSKNLVKLINSSMSSRSKFGLGYGDTFGSDEVFDLSAPRTFMPPSNKPDIDDTQFTYGSKSNNYSESNSVSNDFVSCETSDKSSDSETTGFASCASSVNSSSTMTNASSSVDLKTLHKTDDQGPCNVTQSPSFSFKENVKTPRNLYPGTMVDLNNLQGFPLIDPQGRPMVVLRRHDRHKECLVLSRGGSNPVSVKVVLRVPQDESPKWHRRMAQVNSKTMKSWQKMDLVQWASFPNSSHNMNKMCCLPTKESKTPRPSYKAIIAVSTISEPLQLLHMDLFGPTSIRSIDHKHYSLVVTGTQVTNTHAGTHDDSDSECDDQRTMQRKLLGYQGQAYEANSAAKDTWETADTVPDGSDIPATSIPAGSINQVAGGSAVPSTPSSSVVETFVHFYYTLSSWSLIGLKFIGEYYFTTSSDIGGTFEDNPVWMRVLLQAHVHDQQRNTSHRLSQFYARGDATNKREQRVYSVRYKSPRLVAQGHRQEEGIDYDEVFAPVARIEAIRLFLAFAYIHGFFYGYQMDVRSCESLVWSSSSTKGLVYVDDIIFGSTNKAWCTEFEVLMKGEFEMSAMGELTFFLGLQVKQQPDGIFISQIIYDWVHFVFDASRLRYCVCSECLFRTPVPMVDRNSYNWCGAQFLGRRLISWQCKKQTVVATSSTEAEYVAAAHCCGQSTICIVKNPVFHQRTKHIEIRHHFIRDANEKNLIQVDNLGYPTEGKLTFHKNKFSPQWRFLIHTLLHCLSTKSGSWDQFGSPLAIALICLCEGKKYNWSRYIFTGMVNNINNSKKFLMFPRLNFHGDHMPLVAAMLPPPQAAIAAGTSGEAVHHPTSTQSPTTPAAKLNEPVSKPSRPIPTSPSAQVNQQGPSSDPHVESSSKDNASNPDPNVADDPLGGSFFASPSRSTAAPPEGTTSGGAADPHNLTALYTLVSEQGKKIESVESELQAHKLLFKDVMGKLVKRVKLLESKHKARGRNVILSDSDNEEDEEQDVDSLIKLAKAAAFAADTSSVPADATQGSWVGGGGRLDFLLVPPFTLMPLKRLDFLLVPPFTLMHLFMEMTFLLMEEDRLGAEAARKLHEEEQAELARVQEEMKKKRQAEVINSAKYYTDADWSDIMGQVHANQGLTADLLGPDVNEENFAERMVAIIAERRRQFEAQWMDFEICADVEQPGSKKSKSSAATQTHVPPATHQSSVGVPTNVHQSPFVDTPPGTPPYSPKASSQPDVTPDTSVDPTVAPTPPFATPVSRSSGPRTRSQSFDADIKTYSTRRKSLAPRKMPSSEVDLHAPDTSFIKVLSDDVSDASDDDTDPLFWHIFAAWEVILCAWDLSKLYGMVVKHFVSQPLAECFLAWILYMFADYTIASLSAFTHEEMLKHKLEVEIRWYRDDHDIMTVQLIQFIKNRWLPYVPSA
ncbi:ribonuclease H-like domain-containing protein [Tanacetum coccineum]